MTKEHQRLLEDVSAILGQMEHRRGYEGEMLLRLSIEKRRDLIARCNEQAGYFPVGSYVSSADWNTPKGLVRRFIRWVKSAFG